MHPTVYVAHALTVNTTARVRSTTSMQPQKGGVSERGLRDQLAPHPGSGSALPSESCSTYNRRCNMEINDALRWALVEAYSRKHSERWGSKLLHHKIYAKLSPGHVRERRNHQAERVSQVLVTLFATTSSTTPVPSSKIHGLQRVQSSWTQQTRGQSPA